MKGKLETKRDRDRERDREPERGKEKRWKKKGNLPKNFSKRQDSAIVIRYSQCYGASAMAFHGNVNSVEKAGFHEFLQEKLHVP